MRENDFFNILTFSYTNNLKKIKDTNVAIDISPGALYWLRFHFECTKFNEHEKSEL